MMALQITHGPASDDLIGFLFLDLLGVVLGRRNGMRRGSFLPRINVVARIWGIFRNVSEIVAIIGSRH
jgi:hypothetical protein